MLEIIISVALYVGALVLLVKGAFAFCNNSHENVVPKIRFFFQDSDIIRGNLLKFDTFPRVISTFSRSSRICP